MDLMNRKISFNHGKITQPSGPGFRFLRILLASFMILGNSWPGLLLSGSLRFALPAFIGTLLVSAQAMARTVKHAVGPNPFEGTTIDVTQINLSDDPSDADFLQVKAYSEPFIPTSAPAVPGENHDLAQALKATQTDPSDEGLEQLQGFVIQHPSSRWVLVVELNRGLSLYSRGYFSKAIQAYQAAWAAGENEKQTGVVNSTGSGNPKALADRAVGALMQMLLRVGRRAEAQALWDAVNTRRPEGRAARDFENTREALWHMKHVPGRSFLCGPYALRSILQYEKAAKADDSVFQACRSKETGYSLDQVWEMSQQLGMGMQMAKRKPGSAVLVPAVVNWKVGHYAALVAQTEGVRGTVILSKDPTFQNDTLLTVKALDEEASGYFLVPEGSLPQGWVTVGVEEASMVFGKGFINTFLPPPPCPSCGGGDCSGGGGGGGNGGGNGAGAGAASPPTTSCPTSSYNPPGGCGAPPPSPPPKYMPQASIDISQVSAEMRDMPLSYNPPVGPKVNLLLSYDQRSEEPLLYSNFGPNWSFNWQAYIQYDYSNGSASNFNLYNPGGGQESFSPGGNSQYTNSQLNTNGTFSSGGAQGLPSAITRVLEDGTQQVYNLAIDNGSMVTILMTRIIDPYGNVATINYDSSFRLYSITDALGKTTNFGYTDPQDPNKVTRVQDPFGRSAVFTYDSLGNLHSITDQLGLTSSFTYNPQTAISADAVGSMTTPYGTTTFDYTGTSANDSQVRELEMTDPMGLKDHAKFLPEAGSVPNEYPQPPNGVIPPNQVVRTFYWDKKAMADEPLSPSSAVEYIWLENSSGGQGYYLAFMKKALESPIWYNYPGQTGVGDSSVTVSQPSLTARLVMANGVLQTQETTAAYDAFGNPTTITDPEGRQAINTYASNGIDLLSTQDGNHETLKASTYNGPAHEPDTTTDAAGQVTHYGYNGMGQLTGITSPLGEVTAYNRNGNGFLTSIVPPQQGAGVTFTYDNVGRVQTRADATHGTITYTYDNGDRVTNVAYPDGTSEAIGYTNLDVTSFKDRQNRTTGYGYDFDRRMTSMTDPKSQTTRYGWCSCGSLTSITDPKGNQTSFTRDIEGRIIQKSYADGSNYSYQYDTESGNLIQVTDANKQVTQYSYNLDNSLAKVSYTNPTNPTPNVGLAYDPVLPRLTSMTDGTGMTSYNYYPINGAQLGGGKLESVVAPVGTTSETTTYAYDADGRPVTQAIDGTAESYGYSSAELTSVTNPLGGFAYTYDSSSARLVNVAYPNGQSVTMDYFSPTATNGASGSVKDITNLNPSSATLSKFSYTYNPTGEINTWTQTLGSNTNAYAMNYDADSELQAVTLTSGTTGFDGLSSANQSVSYGYDAAGNRTTETAPSYQHTFATNNLNQLTSETDNPISIVGSTSRAAGVTVNGQGVTENSSNGFSTTIQPVSGATTPLTVVQVATDGTVNTVRNHIQNTVPISTDAAGNLLNDGTKSYVWDAANRLVQVNILNAQPPGVADNVEMTYDGAGRRVSIAERHGTTVITSKTFVWCGIKLCQERDSTGHSVTKQFFTIGEQINGNAYYYSFDHLGNVRELTDSSGTVQASYDYDAYGRQVKLSGDLDSDFGYTGFYEEKTVSLDLTLFRAYDPNKGRWLSRDPLGEGAGLNLYAFVGNRSINSIDSLGLVAITVDVGAHVSTEVPGIANGLDISWTENNLTSPLSQFMPNGQVTDQVYGELIDFGASETLSFGGCQGATISIGLGKYGGLQLALQQNASIWDPSTWIYGIGLGFGLAISLPITVSP